MRTLAEISIGRPEWLWGAVAVLVAVSVLAMWSYGRARMSPGGRLAAGGLRILGTALLCLCLLDVRWTVRRPQAGANLFVVLADRGRGLEIRERAGGQTRAEMLAGWLRREGPGDSGAGWQETLAQTYDVRNYAFGDRLESVGDFESLSFDASRSQLGAALKLVAQRYRNRPLAGILVLSDGNATDLGAAADLGDAFFEEAPPIYAVVAGGELEMKDLAITDVHVSQTVFEDAPVNIDVDVRAWKCGGSAVSLRLRDESGAEIEKQTHQVRGDDDSHRFRLRVRPVKTGVLFYRLEISQDEDGTEAGAAGTGEATAENNRRLVVVERPRGPYRILYVAGRPNWEYKYLRRALTVDPQVEMVGLMRVAKREPKFQWRGRAGESSNPLFRGFGKEDAEEGPGYDKPVIVRLDTKDAAELGEGFPGRAEELFAGYEALILDDVEASFFTTEQMRLIEEFVSRRGGGFIMLGGQESFRGGEYQHTPIAQILPVYLDRLGAPEAPGPLRFELTREGWLEPWLRLRTREEDERLRLGQMSRLLVLNQVSAIKPGASVLATVAEEGARMFPAVVAQRFGEGRVLAVTVGDFWRWGLRSEKDHADMDKLWRQLARWAMADVPRRVMLATGRSPDEAAGGGVRIEARVKDREFRPMENARVEVAVTGPSGALAPATADPSVAEAGLYEVSMPAAEDGGYRVAATVSGEDGEKIATEAAGWVVDAASEEFRRTAADHELMAAIAERSGGASIGLGDLPGLVKTLPQRAAPVMEVKSDPLWHKPWIFLLALACFAAEWAIRRKEGMV